MVIAVLWGRSNRDAHPFQSPAEHAVGFSENLGETEGVNFLASGMSFTSTVGTVVNGTSGIDIIKLGLGASTGNTINSGDSVDQIRGSNGVDTINGGIGNDKIMGIGSAISSKATAGLGRLQTGLQTLPSAETS